MCGIAGIYNTQPGKPVDKYSLLAMSNCLNHRGPDDCGIFTNHTSGLGHSRLSIIDLSKSASQPMCNEDKTLWIVFNGEIYNYKQLRATLHDHEFVSNSDTEVILHMYEEDGADCLTYLNGMFAFAILDTKANRLFLARDRIGKKPLYYSNINGQFLFASEPKSLLVAGVPRDVDLTAISHYLTFGYVPNGICAFKHIRQLPPAHAMIVTPDRTHTWKYYDYSREYKKEPDAQEITSLISESVRARLVSDVPVGVLLSGGIDSSIITAVASDHSDVNTFCMGFDQADLDERPAAQIVSSAFNTKHESFCAHIDPEKMLPKLVTHYDEPFADSSAIATLLLAEQVSKHVKVVLTGDGGDEVFGGYRRYTYMKSVTSIFTSRLEAITYSIPFCIFSGESWRKATTPEFEAAVKQDGTKYLHHLFSTSTGVNTVDRAMDVDTRLYLPCDLLVKMDRAMMAYGVEARSPFLDYILVEYGSTIPTKYKVRGSNTKVLLKQLYSKILPQSILDRKKMGFGVPISTWLRGPLYTVANDIFHSSAFINRGWINPANANYMLHAHYNNTTDYGTPLWCLLVLELWAQKWLA